MTPAELNKLRRKIWMVPVCKAGHPQVEGVVGQQDGKPICLRCVQKMNARAANKTRKEARKQMAKQVGMCPVHRIPFINLSPEHDTRRELGYIAKCPWRTCHHGIFPRDSFSKEYLADFGRRNYLSTLGHTGK